MLLPTSETASAVNTTSSSRILFRSLFAPLVAADPQHQSDSWDSELPLAKGTCNTTHAMFYLNHHHHLKFPCQEFCRHSIFFVPPIRYCL